MVSWKLSFFEMEANASRLWDGYLECLEKIFKINPLFKNDWSQIAANLWPFQYLAINPMTFSTCFKIHCVFFHLRAALMSGLRQFKDLCWQPAVKTPHVSHVDTAANQHRFTSRLIYLQTVAANFCRSSMHLLKTEDVDNLFLKAQINSNVWWLLFTFKHSPSCIFEILCKIWGHSGLELWHLKHN